MARIIDAFSQFFDDAGSPLVDGWLQFTVSGTNNSDKGTFKDIQETISNTNPLQLDAAGRCPNVFGTGSYRVTSFTNNVLSNVPGQQLQQFDPVSGTQTASDFSVWDQISTYTQTDIVKGSNNLYYQSLTSGNVGNDPTTDLVNWEKIDFVRTWNTNKTYAFGDSAVASDFVTYMSLISSNQGNDPTTSPDQWSAPAIPFKAKAPGVSQFNSVSQVDVISSDFVAGELSIGDVVSFIVSMVQKNDSAGQVVFTSAPTINGTQVMESVDPLTNSPLLRRILRFVIDIRITSTTTADLIAQKDDESTMTEGVYAASSPEAAFEESVTVNDITSMSNTLSFSVIMDTADLTAGWDGYWATIEHIKP